MIINLKTRKRTMQFVHKIAIGLALFMTFSTYSHASEALQIGIAPHSSVRIILESHASLRAYLESYFNQPVQIATAPNFSEFAKRSNQGDYDLIITSPHLALMAQEAANYQPLMTYTQGLETVIVAKEAQMPTQRPLRVVGLDPISFVTLTGLQALHETELGVGQNNLNVQYSTASDNAAILLTQDKADIAIMSLPNYNKLNDTLRAQVNIVWRSQPKPSRIYLAKAGKGYTINDWQQALSSFTLSPQGQEHLKDNKLKEFRSLILNELDSVKPLARMAKKILEHPPE
jgi:phosphonate transport system substrate-binding protein